MALFPPGPIIEAASAGVMKYFTLLTLTGVGGLGTGCTGTVVEYWYLELEFNTLCGVVVCWLEPLLGAACCVPKVYEIPATANSTKTKPIHITKLLAGLAAEA